MRTNQAVAAAPADGAVGDQLTVGVEVGREELAQFTLAAKRAVLVIDPIDRLVDGGRYVPGAAVRFQSAGGPEPLTAVLRRQDLRRAWGPVLLALFVAERDFLPGEDATSTASSATASAISSVSHPARDPRTLRAAPDRSPAWT
ncbi:MAG TPA: hypothetical protein VEK09_08065 [Jatrophihabitantaceae bacterium]|nr:hypothetical protein [Jatrophihabitantaceae bacterium]